MFDFLLAALNTQHGMLVLSNLVLMLVVQPALLIACAVRPDIASWPAVRLSFVGVVFVQLVLLMITNL